MNQNYDQIQAGVATTGNPFLNQQTDPSLYQPVQTPPVNEVPVNPVMEQPPQPQLFSIHDFVDDLAKYSETRNRNAKFYSNNINSYDVASNCIREVVFKIINQPIESYKDVWLPVLMRSTVGNGIHEFIQKRYTGFTEEEVTLKVPSLRLSMRLDNLIGANTLVEIKSCAYSDYSKIIRKQAPRDADFYQTMLYRWTLHNHLEEAKQQKPSRGGKLPKLDAYDIKYVQIVYVAHDLISADATSMTDAVKKAATTRKLLNSKYNKFHYITTITLDMSVIDTAPYEAYIVEKIHTINDFLNKNQIPPMNNKFTKPDSCFFCLYKDACKRIA